MPLLVFVVIAAPMWMFAQCLASKVAIKTRFVFVVVMFVLAIVPSFLAWFLLFEMVCEGSDDTSGAQVMCFVWSVVNTVYE